MIYLQLKDNLYVLNIGRIIMKEKGLLKLNVGNKKRSMNYIKSNGKLYVITSKNSKKIEDLTNTNEVELAFGQTETVNARATVINELNFVQSVFDTLTKEGNNHFKKFKDDFVTIEFVVE
jgi:general stress protein 26